MDFITEVFPLETENRRERVLPSGHIFACGGRITGHCETYQEIIFSEDRLSLIGQIHPPNYQTLTVGDLVAWCEKEIERYKQYISIVESIKNPLCEIDPAERL